VCRTIYDAIQIVRRFPESGKTGMEAGTRELVVPALRSYIVVYRVGRRKPFTFFASGTVRSSGIRICGKSINRVPNPRTTK
jgi:hypothetical protein